MRIGNNPHKDKVIPQSNYLHQVVIPVYIPNQESYFKDSFRIFQLCIESLLTTIHDKTFITIVNNGSGDFIKDYLDKLFKENKIQEIIHTQNIGKLNAILKGLAGNRIKLVTISDSDVLFLPNWQMETIKIFNQIPNVGVVGIVPQFKMYENYCGNVIFDNLFNKNLKFIPVKNQNALVRFYDSISWDRKYNQNYLEYNLGLEINPDLKVLLGSGHFVATYKKDIFDKIPNYIEYKLGGDSEGYLDRAPLKKGYWRITTYDNFAYHMGNIYEDWMRIDLPKEKSIQITNSNFRNKNQVKQVSCFMKNRLFIKFISIRWMYKLFLKWKKLPKRMIETY